MLVRGILFTFVLTSFVTETFIQASFNRTCPCEYEKKELYLGNNHYNTLCIINLPYAITIELSNITLIHIANILEARRYNCSVIIVVNQIVKNIKSERISCPGKCVPYPVLYIPISWLHNPVIDILSSWLYDDEIAITCSITSKDFLKINNIYNFSHNENKNLYISKLLEIIFWRRLQECYEMKEWIDIIPLQYKLYTRTIYSIIIWIGSITNRHLLDLQSSVLNHQPFHHEKDAVIGWLATEGNS